MGACASKKQEADIVLHLPGADEQLTPAPKHPSDEAPMATDVAALQQLAAADTGPRPWWWTRCCTAADSEVQVQQEQDQLEVIRLRRELAASRARVEAINARVEADEARLAARLRATSAAELSSDVLELATLPEDSLLHIVTFLMPPAYAMLAATSSQLRTTLGTPQALAALFNGVVVPAQMRLEDALRRLKMEQTLGSLFELHAEARELERTLTAVRL